MHKLVILVEPLDDWDAFESRWPEFLHFAEDMPGLRREATSRVLSVLYGEPAFVHMHELFFDDLAAAEQALVSPSGQSAGRLLQQMSSGKMVLFFAEHKEDDLVNILKYRQGGDAAR
jgi:uncharacterized protein (TIGR02118 family)